MQGCPPAQWPLAMYGKSLIFFFFFFLDSKCALHNTWMFAQLQVCVWLPVKAREPRGSWASRSAMRAAAACKQLNDPCAMARDDSKASQKASDHHGWGDHDFQILLSCYCVKESLVWAARSLLELEAPYPSRRQVWGLQALSASQGQNGEPSPSLQEGPQPGLGLSPSSGAGQTVPILLSFPPSFSRLLSCVPHVPTERAPLSGSKVHKHLSTSGSQEGRCTCPTGSVILHAITWHLPDPFLQNCCLCNCFHFAFLRLLFLPSMGFYLCSNWVNLLFISFPPPLIVSPACHEHFEF